MSRQLLERVTDKFLVQVMENLSRGEALLDLLRKAITQPHSSPLSTTLTAHSQFIHAETGTPSLPVSELKRSLAAQLRPVRDMDVVHTRNTASEKICVIQTHDKPSSSLRRPRCCCSIILSHRSWFITCAGLEMCTFSLSKCEHSYTNQERQQLLAFAHFETLVVIFNKVMFNKTKVTVKITSFACFHCAGNK